MKIVIVLGSIRLGRQSHKVAEELQKRLAARPEVEVELIDLLHYPLPLMEERVGRHPNLPENAKLISEKLKWAEGVVLVSPEYHGSYSGVLKNALDYIGPEVLRKPIGVVADAGGRLGGINASTALQQLVLSIGAFAMPMKLIVPFVQQAFDEAGNIKEEALATSFEKFIDELLWFVTAITNHRKQTGKA